MPGVPRNKEGSSPKPQESVWSREDPILDFSQCPALWEHKFLLLEATRLMVIFYGTCRELIHGLRMAQAV